MKPSAARRGPAQRIAHPALVAVQQQRHPEQQGHLVARQAGAEGEVHVEERLEATRLGVLQGGQQRPEQRPEAAAEPRQVGEQQAGGAEGGARLGVEGAQPRGAARQQALEAGEVALELGVHRHRIALEAQLVAGVLGAQRQGHPQLVEDSPVGVEARRAEAVEDARGDVEAVPIAVERGAAPPPGWARRSRTRTPRPRRASSAPAVRPPMPAPITTRSRGAVTRGLAALGRTPGASPSCGGSSSRALLPLAPVASCRGRGESRPARARLRPDPPASSQGRTARPRAQRASL